jgi:hypothetical protein
MKGREIIGSVADNQMDIFWEEYKSKLNPTLKYRPEEDSDEGVRPIVIKLKIQLVKPPSVWQKIKRFIRDKWIILTIITISLLVTWYALARAILELAGK